MRENNPELSLQFVEMKVFFKKNLAQGILTWVTPTSSQASHPTPRWQKRLPQQ